jgi:hypothetical protein
MVDGATLNLTGPSLRLLPPSTHSSRDAFSVGARTTITNVIRSTSDLSDVCRAIAVAARLMGEKLDALESDLIGLLLLAMLIDHNSKRERRPQPRASRHSAQSPDRRGLARPTALGPDPVLV